MSCCTPGRLICVASVFSFIFFVTGTFFLFFWTNFLRSIIMKELTLANPNTQMYKNWIHTPIEVNLEVYLFNWTNSEEFQKAQKWIKPKFQQLGPYVYTIRENRENVVFNDNYTISFNTAREFHFRPEKSNGSLNDMVTIMNPIVVTISKVIKYKPYLIKRGVHHLLLEENMTLAITQTAGKLLFDGVDDIMIPIAKKLKLKGFEIPYDKFGWFYARNNSASYDGNYTMWTGADDYNKNGIVTEWNQSDRSKYYEGECGRIDGSTGEVWNPVDDAPEVSMFVSDTCSKLTLQRQGSETVYGIKGNLYVATDKLFDNGQKYPEVACFSPGTVLPSGVRNISDCKYKSPVFISLPHFNLADESYLKAVDGMNPDPEKHIMSIVLEPNFGLPLKVVAAFQGNIWLEYIDGIDIFKNVKGHNTMAPLLWLYVKAGMPEEFAYELILATVAVRYGKWLGFPLLILMVICVCYVIYMEKFRRKITNNGKT